MSPTAFPPSTSLGEQEVRPTVTQCNDPLRAGDPRIETQTNENRQRRAGPHQDPNRASGPGPAHHKRDAILPITMQPGEELIVGNGVRKILDKARKQSA